MRFARRAPPASLFLTPVVAGASPLRVLLVAAFLLLPGCVLSGGPDDLTLVCERRTGGPGHPYPPEEIARRTTVAEGLDAARRDEVFRDVAGRLLTPGAAPYRDFSATLTREEAGAWVFAANGTWEEEGRPGVDRYLLAYAVDEAGARVVSPEPALVEAPERLRFAAMAFVNRTAELNETRAARPNVGSVAWDPELPACVRMAYYRDVPPFGPPTTGGSPPPATPQDAGEPVVTHVWVNLARGQVVYVDDLSK